MFLPYDLLHLFFLDLFMLNLHLYWICAHIDKTTCDNTYISLHFYLTHTQVEALICKRGSTHCNFSRVQSLCLVGYIHPWYFYTSQPPFLFWYVNPSIKWRVHMYFIIWDVNLLGKTQVESPFPCWPQVIQWKVLWKRPYNGQTKHSITTILLH